MGMLEGKVVGEVMAIKIAEIGAQGEERTFVIISRDESGNYPLAKVPMDICLMTVRFSTETFTTRTWRKRCR